MYKRITLYSLIIVGFYYLLQNHLVAGFIKNHLSVIGLVIFIIVLFLGIHFYLRYRYKRILSPEITSLPVEFNSVDGFNVLEVGWLYNLPLGNIITAGIIELWQYDFITIEVQEKIKITLNHLPENKNQLLLLEMLYEEKPTLGEVLYLKKKFTSINHYYLMLFVKQRGMTLSKLQLTTGHENNKTKNNTIYRFLVVAALVLILGMSAHPIIGFILLVLMLTMYKQIHRVLYQGTLTIKGQKIYSLIHAYRRYIYSLGKERFQESRLDLLTPHTYEELPYVILFGRERQWIKQFGYLWGQSR